MPSRSTRPRSLPSTATRRSRSRSSSSRSTGCASARGGSPRFAARTSCPPQRPTTASRATAAFLRAETPALDGLVKRIAARQLHSGPARGRLLPEPLSTDLENHNVDSVSGQIEAVAGTARDRPRLALDRLPGARRPRAHARPVDRPLAATRGRPRVGAAPRRLALRARPADDAAAAVRPAHGHARRLVLEPRDAVRVRVRLVPAGTRAARGDPSLPPRARLATPRRAAHLRAHGLRRRSAGAGLAQVYGLSTSRFLADNDQPDQLDLSLYGMLAAGMTQDTYVSGEAVSLLPVSGAYYRTMFMPPNSGANASYPRDAARAARPRAPRTARRPDRARSRLLDAARLARRRPDRSTCATRRRASARCPTRSSAHGSTIDGELVLPPRALPVAAPAAGGRAARACAGRVAPVPVDRAGTIDLGGRRGAIELRATITR